MKFIEGMILDSLNKINGERTIYSIYHLLKGKKSSQTIQDAHLYGLTKYFGVFPQLTREYLEEIIQAAKKTGLIHSVDEQRYVLHAENDGSFSQVCDGLNHLKYLNGWKYLQAMLAWQRLSLLVQVLSNLMNKETNYLPVQKNKEVHQWLKQFLKTNGLSRQELANRLHDELIVCLEGDRELRPEILVYRLTGSKSIGLTATQNAEVLKMEDSRYQLEFLNVLHYLLQAIDENPGNYPLLSFLADDLNSAHSLTLSSRKTLSLVNQGFSLEQIANIRHLKLSTIEDHVVEIALNVAHFSIEKYIDKKAQTKIISVAREENTRQLKTIRNMVQTANYFEIRLVLAKYGAKQC